MSGTISQDKSLWLAGAQRENSSCYYVDGMCLSDYPIERCCRQLRSAMRGSFLL